jgi:hypothetical protein
MSIESRPEYQAALIQQQADIDVELREIDKCRWRTYIADCIAQRVVSPMRQRVTANLEKGYSDDIIS